MNASLITLAVAIVLLLAGGFAVERSAWSLRKLSLVVAMTTLAAVARLPFLAIPGVQPTTVLVILTGFAFGPLAGFFTGAMAALVSNMFLGQGPWTIWQMFAWGLCGFLSGGLARVVAKDAIFPLAAYAFAWGFFFGWIMNLWHWLTFIQHHTWQTWVATISASFWFDFVHGVSSAVFVLLAGKAFLAILRRYGERAAPGG